MLIFSYRLLQLIIFPVILIIGLIRILNKKENPPKFDNVDYFLSEKKEFSFSKEELILVNNLFNFSPGKFLQFYPENRELL